MTTQSTPVTASVLTDVHALKLIQRDLPPPGPGEVRVRVEAVGLCGSDLHYYHQLRNGEAIVREPMTLGHEAAGVVEALGPAAASDKDHGSNGLRPGDRVALELGTPCGTCRHCRRPGSLQYNLCPRMQFAASAGPPGGVSNSMSFELGALVEPLAVAVHAYRRAGLAAPAADDTLDVDDDGRPQPKNILILGAGPVGLLCAAVCRYTHAQQAKAGHTTAPSPHIVIVDIVQDRVNFATDNGLADVGTVIPTELLGAPAAGSNGVVSDPFANAKTMSARLLAQTGNGEPFDVTFECTGQASSVQTGIFATVSGGRVVIVGMGQPAQLVPIGAASSREVDIVGVFRYATDYPEAIRLLRDADAEQLAHFNKIISHSVQGLDNAAKAFERASKPYDDEGRLVLKVMIKP
ncbi:sorbitol dehydrogenase [Niveomyces insectorum RCEF 264]|uniref:Sorbitol dehydrogenase n=1 Tax=Niveomyces insectorum RCEF 264 TaxID=1081102 RepID=A0A167W9B3_9HYPO|nr:sorbitol dehydrogenase [Niveomyces insectorum RCEF 264]